MAEDEQDFVLGHALDGGIPHDDALGRAQSGGVGVHDLQFRARVHLEHAVLRNLQARALDHLLDPLGEMRLRIRQRRELEK